MKKLNVPDWLSIYRIIISPLLLVLIFLDEKLIFTWFLLVSFATDMLDGFIARRFKLVSERGARLDSAGDMITFLVAIVALLRFEWDFVMEHITPIAAAVLLYVFSLLLSFIRFGKPSSFHTYIVKFGALLQGIFLLWLFFFGPNLFLFYSTIIVGILSVLEEIVLTSILPEWRTDVKGLYWVLKERRKAKKAYGKKLEHRSPDS